MNPPTAIEDQLRASLQRQAGHTAPRADAADVRRRVQRRRRRRQVIPAVSAVAVIGAGVVVTMRQTADDRTSTAADDDGTTAAAFTPRVDRPPYVELPEWQVTRYQELDIDATLDRVAQVWIRGHDHRQAQVQVRSHEGTFALGSGERPITVNGARGAVSGPDAETELTMLAWEVPGGVATVIAERMTEADAMSIAEGVTVDGELHVTAVDRVPDGMTVEFAPLVTGSLHDAEYQWSNGDQQLQLHLYDGGQAVYDMRVDGDVRGEVEVFGLRASLLDYGTGRYRVDVLIGEHTFEFDGESFSSAEDFLATVSRLRPATTAPPPEVTAERVTATQGADGGPSPATVPADDGSGTATTVPAGK